MVLLLAVLAAADAPPPPPALPKRPTVALLPLEAFDITPELVRDIEQALITEIEETPKLRAISPADVTSDLGTFGLSAACDGEVSCLARAGRYARAHFALEVRVAAAGGSLNIALRLVDTQKGADVRRVSAAIAEAPAERAEQLHRLAVQLFQPESYVGSLNIDCDEKGASVFLDDTLVGTTPIKKPLKKLTAGPHILRVTKPGFSDLYRFVDVVYNKASTFKVDLSGNTFAATLDEVSTTGFGSLELRTKVAGVEVRIDGEPHGMTPLAGPIDKVAAGERRLSLRLEAHPPYSEAVQVVAGERIVLAVELVGDALEVHLVGGGALGGGAGAPSGPSFGWRGITGTVVGGLGVVSLVGFAVVAAEVGHMSARVAELSEQLASMSADDLLAHADDVREARRLNREGPRWEHIEWACLGTGLTLALVSAGFFLWEGLRDDGPESGDSALAAPEVSASVAPGGLAAAVSWRF